MILVLVEESDNDYGGELSNEDFANAENPQFARVSKGGEVNAVAINTFTIYKFVLSDITRTI